MNILTIFQFSLDFNYSMPCSIWYDAERWTHNGESGKIFKFRLIGKLSSTWLISILQASLNFFILILSTLCFLINLPTISTHKKLQFLSSWYHHIYSYEYENSNFASLLDEFPASEGVAKNISSHLWILFFGSLLMSSHSSSFYVYVIIVSASSHGPTGVDVDMNNLDVRITYDGHYGSEGFPVVICDFHYCHKISWSLRNLSWRRLVIQSDSFRFFSLSLRIVSFLDKQKMMNVWR